jgi:hypothetical protein
MKLEAVLSGFKAQPTAALHLAGFVFVDRNLIAGSKGHNSLHCAGRCH